MKWCAHCRADHEAGDCPSRAERERAWRMTSAGPVNAIRSRERAQLPHLTAALISKRIEARPLGLTIELLDDEPAAVTAAIEKRARYILDRRSDTPETARAIARFTLGGWAKFYPTVQAYDMGEASAIFLSDRLAVRRVYTEDAMHEALKEWK